MCCGCGCSSARCWYRGCGTGRGCRKCPRSKYQFKKPCIDTRIYRNCQHMCISYAGHIPGEQFIFGRNLPTTTTFSKRRLCQFTPYEFIDPDGCCTNNGCCLFGCGGCCGCDCGCGCGCC